MDLSIFDNIVTTRDYDFIDNHYYSTPAIREILEDLYPDIINGKKGVIDRILKYIKKYPKVPAFMNYLTVAYLATDRPEKAYEYNRKTVQKHPNYLFGIINIANEHLDKEEYDMIPQVLGETFDIRGLDSKRDKFHEDEVMSYYVAVIRYMYAKESPDIELVEEIIDKLIVINPEHDKLGYVEQLKHEATVRFLEESAMDEMDLGRSVEVLDRRSYLQTSKVPDFNFPDEIQVLYENDLSISEEAIMKLLDLDHQKLGDDLIRVLTDSIYRFDYFEAQKITDDVSESNFCFPIHAMFLLTAVKHEKALETIFEILRQDLDFIEFWFGRADDNIFVPILYNLAKDKLPVLLDFVKEPNIGDMNKSLVTQVVTNTAMVNPERRDEIIEWTRDFLNFMILNIDNPDVLDTNLLGLYMVELIPLRPKELLLLVKRLFDLDAVSHSICGSYEDIEDVFNSEPNEMDKMFGIELEFDNVIDLYARDNDLWGSEFDDDDYDLGLEEGDYDFNSEENKQLNSFADNLALPLIPKEKVGRNDLCPCGSGKKYKKCCLN